ncbi:hypothetical protein CFC21_106767 [Triticum aestivum]|uniref:Uncharacterized protein n=2 Tax=Triticum aestivum TaxID=4565 RepID=A0A9R1MFD1_WHEAT|nr:hypothetical protein CFC21_106763 [Triticum aestivum]KAF7106000.1 hypothetical protein CFC21_106764 [Triticum aestivum]KAF7106002.1 hypothetical protein CFC21_106766 [Triticum aestivum]KAF7106003.1 hypothetical protein CFC21_106767 [Triticum aestivum]
MAGKEEAGKLMVSPGSAANSAEAGVDGPAAVFSSAAGFIYKEGDESEKGFAAIEKMLGEANLSSNQPAAAPPGPNKGKVRLSKAEIRSIIALKPEQQPSADYLDDLAEYFPPEWIEERKRAHADSVKLFKKMDDDFEEYRQQVIASVRDKGYFEVDEDFIAKRERDNELCLEQQRRIRAANPCSRKYVASPEDTDGYIPYVPTKADALVDYVVIDDEVVFLKD